MLAQAYLSVRADTSQLSADLANVRTMFQAQVDSAKQMMSGLGGSMLAGLGLGGIGKSFAGAANFEQALASAASKLNVAKGTADYAALAAAAQVAAEEVGISSTEAAAGLQEMGAAGLSARDAIATLPTVLRQAALNNMSVADSTASLVSQVKGYGMAMTQATRVSDLLTRASDLSAAKFQDFGLMMQTSGGFAAVAKQRFEDLVALQARARDAGVQASIAGTGLRAIMEAIASPKTSEQESMIRQLGIDSAAFARGEGPSLIDILKQVESAGINLDQAFKIFGDRGAQVLLKLFTQVDSDGKKGIASVRALSAELRGAGTPGYTEKKTAEITDTFLGELKRTKTVIANVFSKFELPLLEAIRPTLQSIRDMFKSFSQVSPETAARISKVAAAIIGVVAVGASVAIVAKTFALIAGGAGLAVSGLLSLLSTVKTVAFAFAALPAPLWAFAGIVGVVTGMAASAAYALGADFGTVGEMIAAAVDEPRIAWEMFKTYLTIFWETLKDNSRNTCVLVRQFFLGAFEAVTAGARAWYENLKTFFTNIGPVAAAAGNGIKAAFQAGLKLENPLQAYKQEFLKGLDEAKVGMQDVGAAMRQGFQKGFNDLPEGFNFGPGQGLLEAQARMQQLREELAAARNKQAAQQAGEKVAGGEPELGSPANPLQVDVKIKYVGLLEMHKQLQEGLLGGKFDVLGKKQVEGINKVEGRVGKVEDELVKANRALDRIAGNKGGFAK